MDFVKKILIHPSWDGLDSINKGAWECAEKLGLDLFWLRLEAWRESMLPTLFNGARTNERIYKHDIEFKF